MPRITRYASQDDNCHTVIHRDIVRLQAGGNPALPGVAAQMQDLLQRLEQHLAQAGSDKTQLLTARLVLRDLDRDHATVLAHWQAWIPADARPLLSMQEARLLPAQALVEAHLKAALPCEPDALLTSMAVI